MDAKLEQMEATLNNINVFNAGKKRDEAVALLAQLLPEVESFQAETRRLQDMIASSRMEHRSQQHLIHLQGSTLFLHIRVIIPGFPGYVKSPSSEFMKMSQTGAG